MFDVDLHTSTSSVVIFIPDQNDNIFRTVGSNWSELISYQGIWNSVHKPRSVCFAIHIPYTWFAIIDVDHPNTQMELTVCVTSGMGDVHYSVAPDLPIPVEVRFVLLFFFGSLFCWVRRLRACEIGFVRFFKTIESVNYCCILSLAVLCVA